MMNGNLQQLTPEQEALARRQAVLQALSRPQTTVGGGLAALGTGIASRFIPPNGAAPQTTGAAKPGFGMLLSKFFKGGAR